MERGALKILLWHGYLLSGSGSNVYTANVAKVWRAQGHDVLLLCQDRHAGELPFVDEYGEFAPDNDSVTSHPVSSAPAKGSLRVARPDIGEILPVYVWDPYEGFTAKRFVDLDDDELAHYVRTNVDAITTAVTTFEPDVVIIGHEVMGPAIARQVREQTGIGYSVKLHGSALEYAVKKQARYTDAARDGFATADTVVGTSHYMCDAAAAAVPGDWTSRTAVVNPGCDVDVFVPAERDPAAPPTVGFVGKLIAAKGPQNLLAALGRTTAPGLRTTLVGYGDFADGLRELHDALRSGRVGDARKAVADDPSNAHCREFLDSADVDDPYLARLAEVPVTWAGRLDHDRLPHALTGFDILVVPSEVPEAFGMVGAEACAAGVIPIVPRHSGIGEIGTAAEEVLGLPGLLSYDPADPVRGLAERIDAVLAHDAADRADMAATLVKLAHDRWSWTKVAEGLLTACTARA
ncbi:MAG: glycosyltransferase [Streptosporangiales bacterium]|nr:glycosyltransferase [Streptosporangiales bacterium]